MIRVLNLFIVILIFLGLVLNITIKNAIAYRSTIVYTEKQLEEAVKRRDRKIIARGELAEKLIKHCNLNNKKDPYAAGAIVAVPFIVYFVFGLIFTLTVVKLLSEKYRVVHVTYRSKNYEIEFELIK